MNVLILDVANRIRAGVMHVVPYVYNQVARAGNLAFFYLYEKPFFFVWRLLNRGREFKLTCITPFADLEITQNGDCYLCCPSWLPVVIGNISSKNISDIFNSVMAQKIRMSMYMNSLKYCDSKRCLVMASSNSPVISRDTIMMSADLNEKAKAEILAMSLTVSSPSTITEAISELCNIKCKFCWTPYSKSSTNQAALNTFIGYVSSNIRDIRKLSFCGGEPFIQNHVRKILDLAKDKDVKFYFTSNLVHIDDQMKSLLQKIHFDVLHVSLNAASKMTYNKIIDCGDWDSVMKNLDFIQGLRRKYSRPRRLQISMVVTNQNYVDMVDFTMLGIKVNADSIQYYPMIDYGIPAQSGLQIGAAEKQEIREMLKHPVFESHKHIIEVGTLKQTLRKQMNVQV